MKAKIGTKRFALIAMENEELEALIAAESDEHMRAAYSQMLEGCREHPKDRLWYTEWSVVLKDVGRVGGLGFKGPPVNGAVDLGYGIDEEYRGHGYATEAARGLIEWAFAQDGVYFVEAEAEADNAASLRIIEKLGFTPCGMGEEGPRFVLERQPSTWMAMCMCLGLSLGLCFGTSGDNLALGMCLGMAIGTAVGVSLDAKDKKIRKKLKAARAEVAGRTE